MPDPSCIVPAEFHTWLYGARKLLLLTHAIACIVLAGAATHHALEMRHYLGGRFHRIGKEKLYARVASIAYVVVFVGGAALYPTFRYHARTLYLDQWHPWVSNLFDIKENFASLALLLAVAVGVLSFTLQPEKERTAMRIYVAMSFIVAAVVWFNTIAGLIIVSFRSV